VQGYRVEEVDALIERLDAAGAPVDLRDVSFAGRRHGYEMSDVQAWLDDVRPLFNADPSGR
jgi:DivIVA domain-containing protein